MAAHPERMLAKPGMGFDEGFTITRNEMERIQALMRAHGAGVKGGAR
jgi:methylaspartate ammonia-lyase